MLMNNTRSSAITIAENADNTQKIDDIVHESAMLIYITDTDGNILYTADEYKNVSYDKDENENNNPYRKNEEMNWQKSPYRNLPNDYNEFLQKLKENGQSVEYQTDNLYVYGQYISEKQVLYVSTTLDPIGSTADIIRFQLVCVTIISVIIAVILAFWIAKHFSTPISVISIQAETLGSENFSDNIQENFCKELYELSKTLAHTNARLNENNDFQKTLLANISHDLRTPLALIKTYTEEIKDFGDEKDLRNNDCDIVLKETDRLSALVNEILEFTKIQSTKNSIIFESVDFSVTANNVIHQFEGIFAGNGGTIETDIESNIILSGNPKQLERLVYNLIDNAIRHTGESKKISVRLKKNDEKAILSVEDYGNGIPQEELTHIWERYYTYRQRNKQGVSGLGLAIVKEITDTHKGTCSITSQLGAGSCFYITLPMLT